MKFILFLEFFEESLKELDNLYALKLF